MTYQVPPLRSLQTLHILSSLVEHSFSIAFASIPEFPVTLPVLRDHLHEFPVDRLAHPVQVDYYHLLVAIQGAKTFQKTLLPLYNLAQQLISLYLVDKLLLRSFLAFQVIHIR